MTYHVARCRSCGARVIWAVTAANKRMPVDAEPSPDGNLELCQPDPRASVPVAQVVGPLFREEGKSYHTSHFATCPDADEHRRGR